MKLAFIILVAATLPVALGGCGGGKSTTSSTRSISGTTTQAPTSTTPSSVTPSSHEVSPGVVQSSAKGVTATMHAGTHHPRVKVPWPVSFAVTSAGKPAKAEVRYEYLFAGQVVAHRSQYKFHGAFHDTFEWPSSAVGYPLTLRAVVSCGSVTLNLDYPVQVVR